MIIRMTETQWRLIREATITPCGREGKLYAYLGETPGGYTVAGLFLPLEKDYAIRTSSLVELPPRFMRQVVLEARNRGAAGVLELHSHPFLNRASWFSATDNGCIGPVREDFERRIPGIAFFRGVLGQEENGFSLEVWDSAREVFAPMDGFEIVGASGRRLLPGCHGKRGRLGTVPASDDPLYQRTAAIRTPEEHGRVRGANVVVIGAGGLGWPTAQLLAAIGVGRLTLVDADRVEAVNLNRLVGATLLDAAEGRHKVDVLARILRRHDPARPVKVVRERFPSVAGATAVASADLVLIAVDDVRTRHEVLRLCVRHHVAAIDLGTSITMSEDGSREATRQGHVWRFVPGARRCFHQMGLGGTALWAETLQAAQRNAGYVLDVPGQSPGSVQVLNDLVASLGVGLAESWLMGRSPEPDMIMVKIEAPYDVRVRATRAAAAPDCALCGEGGPEGEGGNPFQGLGEAPEEEVELPPLPEAVHAVDGVATG